jgi:hypothetical protein
MAPALNGIQPRDRLEPRDTLQRSFAFELTSARAVFRTDGLNGLRMQAQAFFGGSRGELIQVVAGAKATLALQNLQACLLTEVPDLVDLDGLSAQQRGMLVLDAKAQHPRRHTKGHLALGGSG